MIDKAGSQSWLICQLFFINSCRSKGPCMTIIYLSFFVAWTKTIKDREKLKTLTYDQQYKLNKKELFVMNFILVYNVWRCQILKMHIDLVKQHRLSTSSLCWTANSFKCCLDNQFSALNAILRFIWIFLCFVCLSWRIQKHQHPLNCFVIPPNIKKKREMHS